MSDAYITIICSCYFFQHHHDGVLVFLVCPKHPRANRSNVPLLWNTSARNSHWASVHLKSSQWQFEDTNRKRLCTSAMMTVSFAAHQSAQVSGWHSDAAFAPHRRVLFLKKSRVTSDGSPPQLRLIETSHLHVAAHIKDWKDIWIRWGFPVIRVGAVFQDPDLSSRFARSADRIMEG